MVLSFVYLFCSEPEFCVKSHSSRAILIIRITIHVLGEYFRGGISTDQFGINRGHHHPWLRFVSVMASQILPADSLTAVISLKKLIRQRICGRIRPVRRF